MQKVGIVGYYQVKLQSEIKLDLKRRMSLQSFHAPTIIMMVEPSLIVSPLKLEEDIWLMKARWKWTALMLSYMD